MSETSPLFGSAHAALIFAYHYDSQSPDTPLRRLVRTPGGEKGRGHGLRGVDAAAQAGIILDVVDRLPPEQRRVLRVRYGDVRSQCAHCGSLAPSQAWLDAVEELSHCVELEGLPREVRHAAVERALRTRKWDAARLSKVYGLTERTLRHQVQKLRERFAHVEKLALGALEEGFRRQPGMVPE